MYLKAEHVSKSYHGRKLYDDLSFSMSDGDRLLITGASGTGKTTLVRLILGLEKPDSGSILADCRRNRRGILRAGCVFQEDRLAGDFSPVENILYADGYSHEDTGKVRKLLLKLLPEKSLNQRTAELSGGMKRRVSIARALLLRSDVLIFDEPFSGLDQENREKCLRLMLQEQGRRMLILTAHDHSGEFPDFTEIRCR